AEHARLRDAQRVPAWYGQRSRSDKRQVEAMVGLLRSDFEYPSMGNVDVQLLEQSIRKFTEEQFDALDMLDENPRVLFKGPAGTGKTLLALEAAKRAVRRGENAVLLCHNTLLGKWLRKQT